MQSSSVAHSSSFHPVFKTTISLPATSDLSNCSLHLHYALPPIVFIDPYELSARADAYSFQYAPSGPLGGNLELPLAALDVDAAAENASLLLNVAQGVSEVEVPLHVRYGATTRDGGEPYQLTQLSWPDAFLACPASTSAPTDALPSMRFTDNFDGATIVRLKPPRDALTVETLHTPVGNVADLGRVELGTAVIILAAFVYLVRAAQRTAVKLSRT